ncbi:MAG: VacJ protein [Pseudomonadota bacterium]|nr:VacJ protein [Pseudomonadota bacterium]
MLRVVLLIVSWWGIHSGLAVAETGSVVPGTLSQAVEPVAPVAARDPYENFNRQVFGFNAWLVRDVVDPVAYWLGENLPQPIQQAGSNIYNNLVEPEFIVTNLFAGDHEGAKISGQRFLINTTLGIVGIWDAADWLGYQRREVEFIESLCAAGWNPGEFIVLPAIGPANAYAAAMVTGFFAVEWYLLSYVSATLATADLVVDLSASAASLRYARAVPGEHIADPYQAQREEFMRYHDAHCHTHPGAG